MNKITSGALALVALAAAGAASAQSVQPTNAYASISVGYSHANADCTGTTACDNSSTGSKVLLGYKFLPNLAVEVSYAYLGKITATVDADGPLDASIKGQSIGLGVAALAPFGANGAWTGIARAGIASNRTKVSVSGGGLSGSDSDNTVQPYVGLGLNYAITQNIDIGVAWDATRNKYQDSHVNFNVFSAVVGVKF